MNRSVGKKLHKEARDRGLELIGPGKNKNYRRYRFIGCGHEKELQTSQIRNSGVSCTTCFEIQIQGEAQKVGLQIVGEGKRTGTRNYLFEKCGHKQLISLRDVRTNTFKCRTCIEERHVREASERGLEITGKGKNYQYRLYRFIDCGHSQEITTGGVRQGQFRCDTCLQERFELEASESGLKLLGEGRNSNYRLYQFESCGHEQEMRITDVRGKVFRCQHCITEKLEADATKVGLAIIRKGRSKSFLVYRFTACGHEQEITKNSVRLGTFRCAECFRLKLDSEAKSAGLMIVGEGRTIARRKYKFRKCGHEQDISTSNVRDNTFRCQSCQEEKLRFEAKRVGLKLLGDANRASNYRKYEFRRCGHRQEIRTDQVRDNTFICNTCEKTDRDLPSNVYLLRIESKSFAWLKLGYAKEISVRIRAYGLLSNTKVELICSSRFDKGRDANEAEQALHRKYKRKRIPSKEMKKFHTIGGHSECYPVDLLDSLSSDVLTCSSM